MSAYIVTDGTIDCVVEAMADTYGENIKTPDQRDALGVELVAMNYAAVNDRYGDNDVAPTDYRHKLTGDISKIQRLKAVDCFLYQCLEGDVPDTPLYKRVEEAQRQLMNNIVRNRADYQNAQWGYERDNSHYVLLSELV